MGGRVPERDDRTRLGLLQSHGMACPGADRLEAARARSVVFSQDEYRRQLPDQDGCHYSIERAQR